MKGFSLIELLVVLVLLGAMLGVSGLAFGHLRREPSHAGRDQQAAARTRAIHEGREVLLIDSAGRAVRLLPDGRVLTSTATQLSESGDASRR